MLNSMVVTRSVHRERALDLLKLLAEIRALRAIARQVGEYRHQPAPTISWSMSQCFPEIYFQRELGVSRNSRSSAGACLGVSTRGVVTKPLKSPGFSIRFRIRPGEPVISITYDNFL
jgi:hypothetical protein